MIKKTLSQTLKILLILFVAAAVVCGLWFVTKDRVAGVKYHHIETASFEDKCDQLAKASDADTMISLYDELYAECEEMETQYAVAYVLYSNDMDNEYYSDEQQYAYNTLEKCEDKLLGICHDITESPNAEAFRKHVGDEAFEKFKEYQKYTDRELKIIEEEQKLVDEYYDLYTDPDLTFEYRGKVWDLDMLEGSEGDDLYYDSPEDYYIVAEEIEKLFTEKAGPIYIKLVKLRNEFAKLRGYEDYVAYADEVEYTRDYTDEEAEQLHKDVQEVTKKYIPLYSAYYRSNSGELPYMTNDQLINTLVKYSEKMGSTAGDSAARLKNENLYSIGSGSNRQPGGYTIYLKTAEKPFIFITNSSDGNIYPTLTHEFGHFTEDLVDEGSNSLTDSDCIDLAEIASNGFEGLMIHYYNEIFPKQAKYAELDVIGELMENVIYGSIEDEFQRAVYREEDLTVEGLNRLSAKIYREYGIEVGAQDYTWVFVTHFFEVPMYNISYTVSGLAALQIWSKSESDFEGAVATWEKFLDEGIYNKTYLDVVGKCGLIKFNEPGAVDAICKPALDAYR